MSDAPEKPAPAPAKAGAAARPMSRRKRILSNLITLLVTLTISGAIAEGIFAVVERRELAKNYHRGDGNIVVAHARWGWHPSPGSFEEGTTEFAVTGSVNAMFMNDVPVDPKADEAKTRIMALGDSHTFAVGVSMEETWAKVLERKLSEASKGQAFRVYNAGCSGYNLHQYLLRLIDQGPALKPHYVVVGLSYATDLYDLLPPERGGWIYGSTGQPRDYFDFDEGDRLVELQWDPSKRPAPSAASGGTKPAEVRGFLNHFATFRYLRRSSLALFVASHIKVGGQSLWPNMDVVLEKDVTPVHAYQWRLAEALMLRLKQEAEQKGAKLIIAGIPYLPQVYDEIWRTTFAGNDKYSRTAAGERVAAFCKANGIAYVDTLDALQKKRTLVGHWLHHRKDAHPTAEGQAVIAQVIADAGLIQPAVK